MIKSVVSSMALLVMAVSAVGQQQELAHQEEVDAIKESCRAGNIEGAVSQVEALTNKLDLESLQVVYRLSQSMLWHPSTVYRDERICESFRKMATATLKGTRTRGLADPEILALQLQIALKQLPRAKTPPEETATISLQLWSDLLVAERYWKKALEDCGEPGDAPKMPEGYTGAIWIGMDPAEITDPVFRRQWVEWNDKIRDSGRLYSTMCSFSDLRKDFASKLYVVLDAAYSGNAEKAAAGVTAIDKSIRDETERQALKKAIGIDGTAPARAE